MAKAIAQADAAKIEAGAAGDGMGLIVRQRHADGTELVKQEDGSVLQRNPDGTCSTWTGHAALRMVRPPLHGFANTRPNGG